MLASSSYISFLVVHAHIKLFTMEDPWYGLFPKHVMHQLNEAFLEVKLVNTHQSMGEYNSLGR